jgi:succinate dehydrogenase cytochrome b556 subunit
MLLVKTLGRLLSARSALKLSRTLPSSRASTSFAKHEDTNRSGSFSQKYDEAEDDVPRLLSRDDFPADHTRHRRYNEALGRPMSPCLKNYEFNMNMAASIVHRVTGTAVASLLYGTMTAYAVVDVPFCEMMSGMQEVSPAAVATGKMATVWGFAYHILAGLRHLWQDLGLGLSKESVFYGGLFTFIMSFIAASFLAYTYSNNPES